LKFLGGTIAGLTGNPDLTTPPVLPADLTILKTAYDQTIIKAEAGGPVETALKNAARAAVMVALDKNASYVDINCNGELAILLSSGYEAVSTNRAPTTLAAPIILRVQNAGSGVLKVRVQADSNVKSFMGRVKQASGSEFGPNISFKNSKSILFSGLTAGVNYVLQLCAVGGSNGQSDWTTSGPNMAL
jgi:hypothetical protein